MNKIEPVCCEFQGLVHEINKGNTKFTFRIPAEGDTPM